jgi:plasmid stabilization system protein ParE
VKYQIVFAARAQNDLTDLFDYLLPRAGEAAARRFVEGIYEYCLGFDKFPERGMRHDDIRPGLRVVGYQRHASIAFTVAGDKVIILRIFMRGQDFLSDQDFLRDQDFMPDQDIGEDI